MAEEQAVKYKEISSCELSSHKRETFDIIKIVDMVLFGLLSLHWMTNLVLMLFWRRLR